MGLRLLTTCLVLVCFASAAFAKPEFWELFKGHYKPTGALAKAECVTCHVAVGNFQRNSYGKQLQALVDKVPGKSLTVAMLQQVESEDANGDGVTNIDDIKAGIPPGAPAKPGTKKVEEAKPANAELIPKHSLHPLVVHFPIALFIFGALMDFWAWRTKRSNLRPGAFAAMVVGAVASPLAVGTGIAAWLRIGFALEGTVLIHLCLGISASILMIAVALWRQKGELDSTAYWTILAAATIAVTLAGHFGATLVYG